MRKEKVKPYWFSILVKAVIVTVIKLLEPSMAGGLNELNLKLDRCEGQCG